jgi:hypothetical protein
MLQRIAIGVAAMSWWLICEYVRAKTTNPSAGRWLGFLGFGGAWAILLIAILL